MLSGINLQFPAYCPPFPAGFFTPTSRLRPAAHHHLEAAMTPITKNERRNQNDQRATSIYRRRRDIDQKLRDMRLQRELREVWE